MIKSKIARVPIELDEVLKQLQQDMEKSGIKITRTTAGRLLAQKIPEMNINISVFKGRGRGKTTKLV